MYTVEFFKRLAVDSSVKVLLGPCTFYGIVEKSLFSAYDAKNNREKFNHIFKATFY